MDTAQIEWTQQQVCGECGEGGFTQVGPQALPLCSYCGHEHPLDASQLGDNERFEWVATPESPAYSPSLYVTAYAPREGE